MSGVLTWSIVLMSLVGHGGLHIALYNRVNGFGWPRKLVKSFVKFFLATTILIPLVVLWLDAKPLYDVISGQSDSWQAVSIWTQGYGWICLSSWILLGIPWLVWRPIFRVEWVHAPRQVRVVDVAKSVSTTLPLTTKAKWESRLPFNQLLELSVEEIELPVVGLPKELDGYRIAHVSDVHLTGEVHADYAKFVMQQATAARPDLIALTGDIIDKQPCIDWLIDIFSPAEAPDGCFFILGNHDTRVVDSWETRQAMDNAGWIDLGSQVLKHSLAGVECELIGNEYPWFDRPPIEAAASDRFRLLLSHSPDQLGWARTHGVQLMLAGHTHGGQGRLPVAGPILSPSFHGSRYASGDFFKPPTTMHVTRGVGGVHLLRINCRPELSLLTLRASGSV
ncbi:MAG: metallophosphoesterase [Planctomycetota bacterium]